MKRLLIAFFLVITFVLNPLVTFAIATDLTPSQYKFWKKVASDFCEAKDDGLSLESAVKNAINGKITRFVLTGQSTDLFKWRYDLGAKGYEFTNEEEDELINKWLRE